MDTKSPIGDWLTRKYLEWQTAEANRRTVTEFADFLGISRGAFNKYMNGNRRPRGVYVDMIAAKLGPEIYDLVGAPRPDPGLQYIIQNWGQVLHETRSEAVELFQRAVERGAIEPARRRVGKAQRK